MILPGLVSITFRKSDPETVVRLAAEAGLAGVEWGGDVHVPPCDAHDTGNAVRVAKMTRDSGLETAAYGSYYEAGCDDPGYETFKRVAETAAILGAPTIRAWAGKLGSADGNANPEYRKRIAESVRHMSAIAADNGSTLSFEYHAGSLTDTTESASRFYRDADDTNIRAYWQPDPKTDETGRLESLGTLLPLLSNMHVFHWTLDERMRFVRHPLAAGEPQWTVYLDMVSTLPGRHFALLEFMPGDDPAELARESNTLKDWL